MNAVSFLTSASWLPFFAVALAVMLLARHGRRQPHAVRAQGWRRPRL